MVLVLASATWDKITHGTITHHYAHPKNKGTMPLLKEAAKSVTNVGLNDFV